MSWRFRQSFKIMPGLKLNLSKSGLSASIGGAPFTLNAGSRGLYGTASIPGTGISFRERIPTDVELQQPQRPSPSQQSRYANLPATKEIRSASTEVLTSEGLKELKFLIQSAYEEREDIHEQLTKAKVESDRAARRYKSWENGFLLKKVF